MLPSMLSTQEAAATQQRQRLSESPFEKDLLSSAHSLPGLPQIQSSKGSTLSRGEELLLSSSADVASFTSGVAGSSHRVSRDKEFGKTPQAVNGETVPGASPCPLKSAAAERPHHQQEAAATSACVSTSPKETVAANSSPTACLAVTDAHTFGAAVGTASNSSAADERFFTSSTRDPGSVAPQAYKREPIPPPSVQYSRSSVSSSEEREYNASAQGETERGPPQRPSAPPPPPVPVGVPSSSPFSDGFHVAAAACRADVPGAAVRTSSDLEREREEVSCRTSPDQTDAQYRRDYKTKDVHGAAARIFPRSASPSKYTVEHRLAGRSVKEEDALEVIMRVDAAVEALVAHAEDQAEQIKRLTMMVEDLSLKLEGLQEVCFSGRLVSPPAPAELPAAALAAGATEVRQSRGRMVPPPLPRDKTTDPSYGPAVSSRHGNNAAFERSSVSSNYLATQREAENEALERRRAEEQREAQRREEERLRREEEERKRREELARRAAEEQRRREALDEKRKNIINTLISNRGGSTLFGDDGGAASHRNLFDD